eukprot:415695-Rhodomonas_salina.1
MPCAVLTARRVVSAYAHAVNCAVLTGRVLYPEAGSRDGGTPETRDKKPHFQYNVHQECGFVVLSFGVWEPVTRVAAVGSPTPSSVRQT